MIEYDLNKKGLIVVGTPRSGSHATTDFLFKSFNHRDRYPRFDGEIQTTNPKIWLSKKDELRPTNLLYTFDSLVTHKIKVRFMANLDILKNYQLVNLRRRDKVSQFVSLCLHDAVEFKHSPKFEEYCHFLPIKVSPTTLRNFIDSQDFDKKFKWDNVLYYEDIMPDYNKLNNRSFSKNNYPPFEQIIENFNEVKQILEEYSYE